MAGRGLLFPAVEVCQAPVAVGLEVIAVAGWLLWRLRPAAIAYLLAVEATAVLAVVVTIATQPRPQSAELRMFGYLAVTAGAAIVISAISITMRRRYRRNPWTLHIAYLSAGTLTLPPNLLVLLLLGPLLHGVLEDRPQLHRWLFTSAATMLAAFAARLVMGWETPRWTPVFFLLGGAVLLLTRAVLVAVGLRLRNPGAARDEVLGEPIDVLFGIVAASLGGLLGVAMAAEPSGALLAGPPLILLDLASQLPQWRRSAQRDGKTGLANLAHWENLARDELARANNRGQPVAVLVLDLDHFKRINDRLGHLVGDAVLVAIAVMLRDCVRKEDIVGRFGGEEFVVLLPGADSATARTVADRIRTTTESLSVPVRDTGGKQRQLSGLTVSIGAAVSTRYGYELTDLLAAADAALLAAKEGGRNAVAVA